MSGLIAPAVFAQREQAKLVRDLENQLVHPAAPVFADGRRPLDDGHEIAVGETETANVRPGKTQVFCRGDHQRSPLQALGLFLGCQPADEFISDDTACQFP